MIEHTTAREDILGGQKNPWGFDSIKSKFQVNAGLALPEDRVEQTMAAWTDITQVTDLAGTIQSTLVADSG